MAANKLTRYLEGLKRPESGAAPLRRITLVTLFDEEEYVVDESRNFATIGRNETNTIVLPDERVSRLHCRIDCEPGRGIHITDYSRNGTWITDLELKAVIQLDNKSGWFQISAGYLFLGIHPGAGVNMTRIRFSCS